MKRALLLSAALTYLFLITAGRCVGEIERKAGSVALRCWRCGAVFSVGEELTEAECPSCGTLCVREKKSGLLEIACFGAKSGNCSFIVRTDTGSILVFTGGGDAGTGGIRRYLSGEGAEDVDVLVGADPGKDCLKSVNLVMKTFKVGRLFDPGFRNMGAEYAEFLKELERNGTEYRVVRAMEDLSLGAARFYIVRPSAFAASGYSARGLSLCVVHGGNSFLLSHALEGRGGAALRRILSSKSDLPDLLFEGGSESLRAVASPYERQGAVVIESDGSAIGIKSIAEISVVAGGEGVTGSVSAASGSRGLTRGGRRSGGTRPLGRININNAGASDLETLSGIGSKKAATIIEFREANGPFKSLDDLKQVPGIGDKLFERNRERLTLN